MGEVTKNIPWAIVPVPSTTANANNIPIAVYLTDGEGNAVNWVQCDYTATSAPTANTDSSLGYGVGSRIINISTDKEYVCLDATVGAAIWKETTATAGAGSGDVVGPSSAVANNFASFDTTTGKLIKDSTRKHSDYALSGHNHDANYSAIGHNHNLTYSAIGHNHDLAYSAIGHNHSGVYQPVMGADDNYVTDIEKGNLHAPGSDNQDLSGYSLTSHNHTGVYAPVLGDDDNYVTDAEKIVIGNTSGTNSGDEPDANDTTKGIVELAIASEVTTGTDATRAVTPDALAGSDFGKRVVGIQVFDAGTDIATGDAKAFFRIPSTLNGYLLVGVSACVYTAGTTNTADIQIRNVTDSQDMLSTKMTIDSTETDTATAATPAVINTDYDDVATGDKIAIDVDAVHTTPAKGLFVELIFQLA